MSTTQGEAPFARQAIAVGDTAAARYFRHNAADEAKHAATFQQALNQPQ
ncbi:hypothetical protein P6B95_03755 [Streptomyces atratus]|nr:hypothetical protein [Streptomyces atratus]WPW26628.1 hypothetical protein P6B95_03755 [Streptomyces atratus]GGT61718.1 hypothetical protein GCM10010207_71710 [Streptomyces atratus]